MTADVSNVPFAAVSDYNKEIISARLNVIKILPCGNGMPRDWRGLACLLDINSEILSQLVSHTNPTMAIFDLMAKKRNFTILHFQEMLQQIDRWDIFNDTEPLFESDVIRYFDARERSKCVVNTIEGNLDQEVLTLGDVHRLDRGLRRDHYDAFLLYADEDTLFAEQMIDKLEGVFQLKLCLKHRDLIGGASFEHEAVMKLIYDRCNRLLIIISPNFLNSSANKFFINYAQALSIDKRQRKIIPCLYERCELPLQLRYMFVLDYTRSHMYDFWGRLRDSIKVSVDEREMRIMNVICDEPKDTNSRMLTYMPQTAENSPAKNIIVENNVTIQNKRNFTWLQRVKKAASRKSKEPRQSQELTTESVTFDTLPTVNSENLSSSYASETSTFENLNLSSSSTCEKQNSENVSLSSTIIYERESSESLSCTETHRKKRTNVFHTLMRKVQGRKIALRIQ